MASPAPRSARCSPPDPNSARHRADSDSADLTCTDSIRRTGRRCGGSAGLLTPLSDGWQAWPGWEDATVPPDQLGGFPNLLAEHGRRGSLPRHAPLRSGGAALDDPAATVLASGYCGLAGSFGYQRGHEELAERSLAPAVRAFPDALVLADGCRSPRRRALHLAGLLDVNSLEWTERRAAVVFSPTDDG